MNKKEVGILFLIFFIFILLFIFYKGIVGNIVNNDQSNSQDTFYVSLDGNDDNPGVIDKPWRTLERAFNSSKKEYIGAGKTLYLREGIYRVEQPIFNELMSKIVLNGTKEHPIIISSYPGERARIYLSERIKGWNRYSNRPNTNIYYFNWRSYLEMSHSWFLQGSGSLSKPQSVFIDNDKPTILNQVNSNKTGMDFKLSYTKPLSVRTNQFDMLPGDFYYESDAQSTDFGKLFIWLPNNEDPNLKDIEVGLDYIIWFTSNWTIFQNLTIRYANDDFWAGFAVGGYNNILDNIDSSYNSLSGLDGICHNCIVRNSVFRFNGNIGSTLRGNNTIYENNTFEYNNRRSFDGSWSCGDIKLIDNYKGIVLNMTIRGNKFSRATNCSSLWFDYVNGGHIIENNFFSYTPAPIIIELVNGTIKKPTIIRNNIFAHIEKPGRYFTELYGAIIVASSHYTYIYNNLIYDAPAGVIIIAFDIPTEIIRRYASNNRVLNNIFLNVTAPLLITSSTDRVSVTNITSDYNLFYGGGRPLNKGVNELNDGKRIMFCSSIGNCTYYLSIWRSLGYDLNSQVADPLLNDAGSFNFIPNNKSPVIDKGINIPEVEKDIRGFIRSNSGAYDLGPYELTLSYNNALQGQDYEENNSLGLNNTENQSEEFTETMTEDNTLLLCDPLWSCSWGRCENKKQIYRCIDLNSCNITISKPIEKVRTCVTGKNLTLSNTSSDITGKKKDIYQDLIKIVSVIFLILLFFLILIKSLDKQK